MAILLYDVFDKYSSSADVTAKNSNYTIAGTTSPSVTSDERFNGRLVYLTDGNLQVQLIDRLNSLSAPTSTVIIVGMMMKIKANNTTGNTQRLFEIAAAASGASPHFIANRHHDGSLSIMNASSVEAAVSSGPKLKHNTWHHVEVKVDLKDSGSATVKVDGTTVIGPTSADFRNGTGNTSNIRYVRFNANGGTVEYEVIYVLDGTGSVFNDFIGDLRCERALPTGDGSLTAWTPNTGNRWAAVDDPFGAIDGNTTYIESTVSGDKNTFTFPAFGGTDIVGDPKAVLVEPLSYPTSIGDPVKGVAKHSGTTVSVSSLPTTTYGSTNGRFQIVPFTVCPSTSAQWTLAQINAAEFGVENQ